MKVLLFWLSTLIFIFGGQILTGGHYKSLLQDTGAFIVFGPVIAYLFYSCGFRGFFKFWKRLITQKGAETDNVLIDTASTLGFLMGGMGSIIGMIQVMINLADTSKLGAGVAVCFISTAYGIVPSILLLPIKRNFVQGISTSTGQMKKAAGYMVATLLLLGGTFFTVLYATSYKG